MKEHRQATAADHPIRKLESMASELTSASLDCQRALRDAVAEATFFEIYGNLQPSTCRKTKARKRRRYPPTRASCRFVKEALASIDKGGYAEALARVAFLMAHKDEPLPLSRLQLAHDLLEEYRDLLPDLPLDEARRIGGEQEIIARYEPEKAVQTLPFLLSDANDRDRLLTLLDRVLRDKRVQRIQPSAEQSAMLARIRGVLASPDARRGAERRGNGSGKVATARRPTNASRGAKRVARNATPAGH